MINLFGKTQEELEELAVELGNKRFRGKQLYDWIYKKKVLDLDNCSNLPNDFKNTLLEKGYCISQPKIVKILTDPEDGTKKYLLQMNDGEMVECVLMKYSFGNTVCLSTQIGCNMGCTFCASGKNGKNRDLRAEEIAGQLIVMEKDSNEPINNIVLMGMGEPLENYDEVLRFIHIANKDLGIGQRHITLSTCGLIDRIYDLAKENLQINLAISLHSPFQDKREKIMPIAKRNPLDKLIKASKDYFKKTGRRVTYEYTVIDGFNNRKQDAIELKRLVGDVPHHINLIPLNTVTKHDTMSSEYVNLFATELNKQNVESTIRKKNGINIEAACGQLRNQELEV